MSPSPSTPAAENPDSPSSPSSPLSAPPESTSRLFAPMPSSSPSLQESGDLNPSSPDSPPSWTAGPADPYSGPGESGDTPSTGSGLKLSKNTLRASIGAGFRGLCKVLAGFVAIEAERELGVWQPDEEDVADVSRPATNIIYRRLPDDAKGGDVIDLVALGLALAAYLGKSLQERAIVRTHLRLQAEQGINVGQEAPAP